MTNTFFLSIYPIEFKTLFYQPTPWMKFLLILCSTIGVCVCGVLWWRGGREGVRLNLAQKPVFKCPFATLLPINWSCFHNMTLKKLSYETRGSRLLEPPASISFFWVWLQFFVQQKGSKFFFHTPPPPLAYTTLDFAELIVGSVDISHWIIQNPHNLVSKAWVDNNERFLHHNPCTQSSNVHFSDFRSNSSQNMRQKKNLGHWESGKRDKRDHS